MLILAGVTINLVLADGGIFSKAEQAEDAQKKAEALDIMSLKILDATIAVYSKESKKANLHDLYEDFQNNEEIDQIRLRLEYEPTASDSQILSEEPKYLYAKLIKYPYEFKIDTRLEIVAVEKVDAKQDGSIEKKDTVNPNEARIDISGTAETTIVATVTHEDNEAGSGIDLNKCRWIHNTTPTKIGESNALWDTAQDFNSNSQSINLTTSSADTYYLHVLSVDKGGNKIETVKRTIIVIYDKGNFHEGYSMGNDYTFIADGYWQTPTKMNLDTDRISFNVTTNRQMQLSFSNQIDFKDINKVFFDLNVVENTGGQYTVNYALITEQPLSQPANDKSIAGTSIYGVTGNNTLEIDIANYTGKGYIKLQAQDHSSNNNGYKNIGYYSKIYCY